MADWKEMLGITGPDPARAAIIKQRNAALETRRGFPKSAREAGQYFREGSSALYGDAVSGIGSAVLPVVKAPLEFISGALGEETPTPARPKEVGPIVPRNRPLGSQGGVTRDTQPEPNPFLNQPLKKEPYLKPGVYGNDPARPITVTDEGGTQVVRGPAIKRPQNTTITYAQEPDYLEPVFYKGKQVGERIMPGVPAATGDAGTSGNEGADVPDRWSPYKVNPLEQRKFDFEVGKYTNAQRAAGSEARAAFIAAIQDQVGDLDKLAAGAIANAAWSNNPDDEAMAYTEAYKLLKEYQDKQGS